MAVTQESRYRMHQRLEEVLGDEPATTLMEHLPPTGWADLATKQDLAHATELLSQRIDTLEEKLDDKLDHRIGGLDHKLDYRIDGLEARLDHKVDGLEARLDHKVDGLEARLDHKIDSLDQKFMSALAVEGQMIRAEIHKSRGDMFKFMIVQVVAFYGANVALVGAAATLMKG